VIHRGLAGTPRPAVLAAGVLPVLEDIEVEAAEVDRAEVMDPLINGVELVGIVGFDDFPLQQPSAVRLRISSETRISPR